MSEVASETFLLNLRNIAKACPDPKLRKEIRECADAMEGHIECLYRFPTEEMLRALQCMYSYSRRLIDLATTLNNPSPTGGKLPVPQERQAA